MRKINNAPNSIRKYIVSESTWFGLIVILSINYIMYVFFNDGSLYWNISGTICAAVTGGLSIVSIMKNNILNKHIVRYIGAGCLYIALLTFLRIILVEFYGFNSNNLIIKNI